MRKKTFVNIFKLPIQSEAVSEIHTNRNSCELYLLKAKYLVCNDGKRDGQAQCDSRHHGGRQLNNSAWIFIHKTRFPVHRYWYYDDTKYDYTNHCSPQPQHFWQHSANDGVSKQVQPRVTSRPFKRLIKRRMLIANENGTSIINSIIYKRERQYIKDEPDPDDDAITNITIQSAFS